MNRTDRLLAIVLELQARDLVTAEELARFFEVTKRTIYRDIQALNESGVPIVSAAGQGYWLMEGYFLPPVSFNSNEVIMLLLGSEVMSSSFDAQYQKAAQNAVRKIEALLPEDIQKEVKYLKENIRFVTTDSQSHMEIPDALQQVRSAIIKQNQINISYRKKGNNNSTETSERSLDPHGLIHFNATWMLYAYCHLRKAMRMFRLDRITKLELSELKFERQAGFSVQALSGESHRPFRVELLFKPQYSQWVKEKPPFYMTKSEDTPEGLKLSLQVRNLNDVSAWILSWGAAVKVLSPASLATQIQEEIKAMLALYN